MIYNYLKVRTYLIYSVKNDTINWISFRLMGGIFMEKHNDTINQCPMSTAMNILNGKWKMSILWYLSRRTTRFNELQKKLPNITQKTLTLQLRELEKDGIITRKVYPEVPPKVEYSLTELGETIKPILKAICRWGKGMQKVTIPMSNYIKK